MSCNGLFGLDSEGQSHTWPSTASAKLQMTAMYEVGLGTEPPSSAIPRGEDRPAQLAQGL